MQVVRVTGDNADADDEGGNCNIYQALPVCPAQGFAHRVIYSP